MLIISICGFQLALSLGCSGSGDDMFAGGGIGGSGITLGTVSEFGSVVVNRSTHDTAATEVFVEREFVGTGEPSILANLDLGKVVRVEFDFAYNGTRTATRIVYNDNVEGPVDTIAPFGPSAKIVVVMGQPVIMDDSTRYKNTSFGSLTQNNVLEVSGHVVAGHIIRATYVEKKADFLSPDDLVDLKGIVQGVDTQLENFSVNVLLIDYSSADTSSLPGGSPADGQLVEIKGTLNPDGSLAAKEITPEDELGTDNADLVELEGFVTNFVSIFNFTTGNLLVETGISTIFEGIAPGDITLDTPLVIKGKLRDGVLTAEQVRTF
jgi:hypothetical protein